MIKGKTVFVSSWEPDFNGVHKGIVRDVKIINDDLMTEVEFQMSQNGAILAMWFKPECIHDSAVSAVVHWELRASKLMDWAESHRKEIGEGGYEEIMEDLETIRKNNDLVLEDDAIRDFYVEAVAKQCHHALLSAIGSQS